MSQNEDCKTFVIEVGDVGVESYSKVQYEISVIQFILLLHWSLLKHGEPPFRNPNTIHLQSRSSVTCIITSYQQEVESTHYCNYMWLGGTFTFIRWVNAVQFLSCYNCISLTHRCLTCRKKTCRKRRLDLFRMHSVFFRWKDLFFLKGCLFITCGNMLSDRWRVNLSSSKDTSLREYWKCPCQNLLRS